mmetsp:Transcript_134186/g.417054  ORF Transcript_134186/g.417054 Transcript_134186/m.417054 type:complete len:227 (-) Transcript_134186:490-1170(-)
MAFIASARPRPMIGITTILAAATASAVRMEMLPPAPLATELPKISMLIGTAAAPILASPLKSHSSGASPSRSITSTSSPRTGSTNATSMPNNAASTGGGKTRCAMVMALALRLGPSSTSGGDLGAIVGGSDASGEARCECQDAGRSSASARGASMEWKVRVPWHGGCLTTCQPAGQSVPRGGSAVSSSFRTLARVSGEMPPARASRWSGCNSHEPTDHWRTGYSTK